jgi:hypothetical protein
VATSKGAVSQWETAVSVAKFATFLDEQTKSRNLSSYEVKLIM